MKAALSSLRGLGSTVLVAALSAWFGTVLFEATFVLIAVSSDGGATNSETGNAALFSIASVFIGIAVYVGAIVTANTFATVIAGRVKTIALLRLIGASSSSLRKYVARDGLVVGALGAVLGAVVGVLTAIVAVRIAVATTDMPDLPYPYLNPALVWPVIVVTLTTWLAAWIGSRSVTAVSPIEAIGQVEEKPATAAAGRPVRTVFAVLFAVGGLAVLALGIVIGMASPLGLFVAFLGGIGSFTAVLLGAHLIMPALLKLSGMIVGRGAVGRLATANSVRYPERSTRSTIGLVIGVTLVTTVAVAAQSFSDTMTALFASQSDVDSGQVQQIIAVAVGILGCLIGFSVIISGVGLVNNLSLGVIQRTREIGLLRALGLTGGQVRALITIESAQMTLTAVVFGLVLGGFYGWAGAQSMLGSIVPGGLVVPTFPLVFLAIVIVGAVALAVIATVGPARRATRIAPIEALADA